MGISRESEWINPVEGIITSLIGARVNPITGKSEFHNGIDISCPEGTPVYATRGATVTFAGVSAANGKYIKLQSDDGEYEIVYAHLSEIKVKTGESVEQGQIIGLSGNTGRSAGPHLHYGLYLNGQCADPAKRVELTFSEGVSAEYARRYP